MIVQEVINLLNEFKTNEVRDYHLSISPYFLDGKRNSYLVSLIFDD